MFTTVVKNVIIFMRKHLKKTDFKIKGVIIMTYLVIPKNRYSCIDWFLEKTENPQDEGGIKIEESAYERMKQDPYLRLMEYEGNIEIWIGDEVTLNGVYFPPLQFTIEKVEDGYLVLEIRNGTDVYSYSRDYSVILRYN